MSMASRSARAIKTGNWWACGDRRRHGLGCPEPRGDIEQGLVWGATSTWGSADSPAPVATKAGRSRAKALARQSQQDHRLSVRLTSTIQGADLSSGAERRRKALWWGTCAPAWYCRLRLLTTAVASNADGLPTNRWAGIACGASANGRPMNSRRYLVTGGMRLSGTGHALPRARAPPPILNTVAVPTSQSRCDPCAEPGAGTATTTWPGCGVVQLAWQDQHHSACGFCPANP